jgi:hypothetical protein
MGYMGISQITLTPRALIESRRGRIPAKPPEALKARSLISYITISDVAGIPEKGVSYWAGSASGLGGTGTGSGSLEQPERKATSTNVIRVKGKICQTDFNLMGLGSFAFVIYPQGREIGRDLIIYLKW